MKNKIILMILLIGIVSLLPIQGLSISITPLDAQTSYNGYTDITVEEAWGFLNSTENGIQIPIDVRRDSEWAAEHIDTPSPENPRHHCECDWDDEQIFQDFIQQYEGKEIIIYCRSGRRSADAAQLLVDNGFIGTIYNIDDGINAWKAAGLPTKPNLAPGIPTITGPSDGAAGTEYEYSFIATDSDDDTISYCINWSDEFGEICIGPYASDEEITIKHSWEEKGTYLIQVTAKDKYDAESEVATLEVNMPKKKTVSHPILKQILQQFKFWERFFL